MDLKEFVKAILVDIDSAVDEAQAITNRNISFAKRDSARTVEFDIAVTVRESDAKSGEAKVKVWSAFSIGVDKKKVDESSTVSHVTFGVEVSSKTKAEQKLHDEKVRPGGVIKTRPKPKLHVGR